MSEGIEAIRDSEPGITSTAPRRRYPEQGGVAVGRCWMSVDKNSYAGGGVALRHASGNTCTGRKGSQSDTSDNDIHLNNPLSNLHAKLLNMGCDGSFAASSCAHPVFNQPFALQSNIYLVAPLYNYNRRTNLANDNEHPYLKCDVRAVVILVVLCCTPPWFPSKYRAQGLSIIMTRLIRPRSGIRDLSWYLIGHPSANAGGSRCQWSREPLATTNRASCWTTEAKIERRRGIPPLPWRVAREEFGNPRKGIGESAPDRAPLEKKSKNPSSHRRLWNSNQERPHSHHSQNGAGHSHRTQSSSVPITARHLHSRGLRRRAKIAKIVKIWTNVPRLCDVVVLGALMAVPTEVGLMLQEFLSILIPFGYVGKSRCFKTTSQSKDKEAK
ncbi:hypothetical protein C8R43DRAFT_1108884 [Mycena crocata]|nr:hypothetical protein C8R43DRAFT_1108884 [Mycena crocata]